jgi:hypothetical protein
MASPIEKERRCTIPGVLIISFFFISYPNKLSYISILLLALERDIEKESRVGGG